MAKAYIYRISNRQTWQFYVGVRWANVRANKPFDKDVKYWGSSSYLDEARAAHPDGWVKELLHEFETTKEAVHAEVEVIASVINDAGCLNKSPGGPAWYAVAVNAGRKHTTEAKTKMTIAASGRKISDEARKAISLAKLGKKQTVEHAQAALNARLCRSSEDKASTALKLSAVSKGLKRTEETRARMSAAQKGNGAGKPWTPARRLAQEQRKGK